MTGKKFADFIRYKTRTNSNTLTNADILLLATAAMEEIAPELLDAQEDIFLIPHTTNLVAGYRLYPFPSNILSRIKRVEAKLDGSKFIKLTEINLNSYPHATDEVTILEQFSNAEGLAKYELGRNAIRIFSGEITSVTDGLKLWCNTYPHPLQLYQLTDDVVDLSTDPSETTHGMPRVIHRLWATRVCIMYKSSREKPIPLDETERKYEFDLKKAIVALRHGNDDREILADIPPASDRGNNGANY